MKSLFKNCFITSLLTSLPKLIILCTTQIWTYWYIGLQHMMWAVAQLNIKYLNSTIHMCMRNHWTVVQNSGLCCIYIVLHGGVTSDCYTSKRCISKTLPIVKKAHSTIHQFMTADQEDLNPSLYQFISEPEAPLCRMIKTDSASKNTTQWG